MPATCPRARKAPAQAGVSLIEILVAATVVAISLLAHAATTLGGHRLTKSDEGRSIAIQATRQFLERMRSDEDWASLYTRMRVLEAQARAQGRDAVDGLLLPPTAYYADYIVPAGISSVGVLVTVPDSAPVGGGANVLREDAALPEFGLPFDLNGDGVIDAASRNADYRALPVMVTFRYEVAGAPPVSLSVHTWLVGER
jgi:hypothetical protein